MQDNIDLISYQNRFVKQLARSPIEWDFRLGHLVDEEADLLHATMGLVTEAGELMDAFKKYFIYGKDLDKTNIKEELGDLLFYLVQAANSQGWSLHEVMETNYRKLTKRYPNTTFTEDKANNRDLAAERKELEK